MLSVRAIRSLPIRSDSISTSFIHCGMTFAKAGGTTLTFSEFVILMLDMRSFKNWNLHKTLAVSLLKK